MRESFPTEPPQTGAHILVRGPTRYIGTSLYSDEDPYVSFRESRQHDRGSLPIRDFRVCARQTGCGRVEVPSFQEILGEYSPWLTLHSMSITPNTGGAILVDFG